MELGLKGKCALVFGAGGGLGSAISRQLAAEGANVVTADINTAKATATAEAIKASGNSALAIEWDIGDLPAIPGKLSQVTAAFGPVAVLVNNTGGPPLTDAVSC